MMITKTIKLETTHENTLYPDPSTRLLYACFDREYLIIPANKSVWIGLGIKSTFDSSIRIRLHTTPAMADLGLRLTTEYIHFEDGGEWIVQLHNYGVEDVIISKLTFDELKAKYAHYYKNAFDKDMYYIPFDSEAVFSTANAYILYIDNNFSNDFDSDYGTRIVSYDEPLVKFEVEYVPPYVLA